MEKVVVDDDVEEKEGKSELEEEDNKKLLVSNVSCGRSSVVVSFNHEL